MRESVLRAVTHGSRYNFPHGGGEETWRLLVCVCVMPVDPCTPGTQCNLDADPCPRDERLPDCPEEGAEAGSRARASGLQAREWGWRGPCAAPRLGLQEQSALRCSHTFCAPSAPAPSGSFSQPHFCPQGWVSRYSSAFAHLSCAAIRPAPSACRPPVRSTCAAAG